MTPYDSYIEYLAIKRHFSSDSYDYHKYRGKIKAKVSTFEARKDHTFFYRLAKLDDQQITDRLVSSALDSPKFFIGSLWNDDIKQKYLDRQRILQGLSYNINKQVDCLSPSMKYEYNIMVVDQSKHPPLLQKYLSGDISDEVICVLNDVAPFFNHWSTSLNDSILWPTICFKLNKYTPFIVYDYSTIIETLRKKIDFFVDRRFDNHI